MTASARCRYALRAVYALAEHRGPSPLKAAEIAERQRIPIKFLEAILGQLKGGGFVQSRRGAEGGYRLAVPPEKLTVGEIIRFIDGPIDPAGPSRAKRRAGAPPSPFQDFWERVGRAVSEVVDETTFADIIRENRERNKARGADWVI